MPTINISDLPPAGFELFSDSESYLHQLTDEEKYEIQGGITPVISPATPSSLPCIQAARVTIQHVAYKSTWNCAGVVTGVTGWFK
jgi:hypothetical protein